MTTQTENGNAQPAAASAAAPAAAPAAATAQPAAAAAAAPAPGAAAAATAIGDPNAGAKPAEGDPQAGKGTGAPEKYEAFKLPEGVALDAEVETEVSTLAREANLPQEKAQKFVDLGGKLVTKALADQKAQSESAFKDAFGSLPSEWGAALQADKEIGGEAFEANKALASKALGAFGTPEFSRLLAVSGLGNHPEIVRFAIRVGKAISEDKLAAGKGANGETVRDADMLYDKTAAK